MLFSSLFKRRSPSYSATARPSRKILVFLGLAAAVVIWVTQVQLGAIGRYAAREAVILQVLSATSQSRAAGAISQMIEFVPKQDRAQALQSAGYRSEEQLRREVAGSAQSREAGAVTLAAMNQGFAWTVRSILGLPMLIATINLFFIFYFATAFHKARRSAPT